MKRITIDGLECSYKVKGEGKQVLLMLHGWGQSHAFWEDLAYRLSGKKYKIYFVDLPGWGMSKEPPAIWGMNEYSDFIQKFLKNFKVKEPIFIGHSFGGRIALNYAERYHLKKLILYSSPGVAHVSLTRRLHAIGLHVFKHLTPNTIYRMHSDWLKHSSYINTARINSLRSRRMIDIYIHNSHEEKRWPVYNGPFLLIYGSADKIVPSNAIKKLQRHAHNAKIIAIVIKDATHFAHLEAPDVFYKHLSNFLDSK